MAVVTQSQEADYVINRERAQQHRLTGRADASHVPHQQ